MGALKVKVTVRLTPNQVDFIDAFMLKHNISSNSKVIRMAIENFIQEHIEVPSKRKVIVHIPDVTIKRIRDAVPGGEKNIEDKILISLNRYADYCEEYLTTRWKQLKAARIEYEKERGENEIVKETLIK